MSESDETLTGAGFLELAAFTTGFERWLGDLPPALVAAREPIPEYAGRVEVMAGLMAALYEAGWARHGWPLESGGLGGTVLHRAAMWEALARHGVPGMALFEHVEILAPVLAAHGPAEFVADVLPAYLSGRELWCQGFSEPDAGSDLASLSTTAVRDGDEFVVNGRKIWTSWARYATWCLLLARTGTAGSRHRGITAMVVDLRTPGVEVSVIEQANGTDELAEVTFDDVRVPVSRIVGELGGGWAVAMHILSHERGTFAWFRHTFLQRKLSECAMNGPSDGSHDAVVGDALLDLVAATAAGHAGVRSHAAGTPLGPRATFNKLLLCAAEQSVQDCALAADPELAVGVQIPEVAIRRQEYLFSRIVTVYGGTQQMQLETISKQLLGLP